jgi:hypothetical protein
MAFILVHNPSAFIPITNVLIAVLMLQLVMPVASMNAIASGSVISQTVEVVLLLLVELLVLEDVEEEVDVLLVLLLDVELLVLVLLLLLLLVVVVVGVPPPPGRFLSFTLL